MGAIFTRAAIAAATLIVSLALSTLAAASQSAPTATPGMNMSGPGDHARIYDGACGALGAVAYDLGDLRRPIQNEAAASSTPTTGTPMSGAAGAMTTNPVVAQVKATVNASLNDLLATPHAINVHRGMESIQSYIACGNITGMAMNSSLTIQLPELNHSGLDGVAVLTDNGGKTTSVIVSLFKVKPATPVATPAM